MTTLALPAKQKTHNPWRNANDPKGRHSGEDYGWASGDQILAAAPGKVVAVYDDGGYNQGWGNRIVINHAPGVHTTYNHIRNGGILVKVGQSVSAGQQIAWMGDTGKVTAKHLHFELEIGGRGSQYRVNPAPYFTKDLPGTAGQPSGNTSLTSKQRLVRQLGTGAWLNGRSDATTGAKVKQRLEPGTVGNFDAWKHGQKVTVNGVTSDVWFRGAYNKNWFAAAGFTSQSTTGLTEIKSTTPPKPSKKNYFKTDPKGTYWYTQYNNALNGDYAANQILPANKSYEVLENPKTGPVKIKIPGIGNKWVGTRNHPAKVTSQ